MNPKIKPRSERQEQVALFKAVKAHENNHPELRLLFAIPNGAKRSLAYGAMMKAQGLKSGVPDIMLPVAKKHRKNDPRNIFNLIEYHGLFIEMKREKTGKVSDSQKWWHEQLSKQGYLVKICYSSSEALNTILDYIKS